MVLNWTVFFPSLCAACTQYKHNNSTVIICSTFIFHTLQMQHKCKVHLSQIFAPAHRMKMCTNRNTADDNPNTQISLPLSPCMNPHMQAWTQILSLFVKLREIYTLTHTQTHTHTHLQTLSQWLMMLHKRCTFWYSTTWPVYHNTGNRSNTNNLC